MNFSSRLKEIRKNKGLTQKQLAQSLGAATERGIQSYESGEREPAFKQLIALADYFDVSLDYLAGRSDVPNETKIKYQQINEIIDITDWNQVNKYLELGWIIINIYNRSYDDISPLNNCQISHYVLGWDSESSREKQKPSLSCTYDEDGYL